MTTDPFDPPEEPPGCLWLLLTGFLGLVIVWVFWAALYVLGR